MWQKYNRCGELPVCEGEYLLVGNTDTSTLFYKDPCLRISIIVYDWLLVLLA